MIIRGERKKELKEEMDVKTRQQKCSGDIKNRYLLMHGRIREKKWKKKELYSKEFFKIGERSLSVTFGITGIRFDLI